MANVTITAANFLPTASATYLINASVAGEAISAGELVYLKTSDQKYWKAIATTAEASTVVGFAANTAATGQRLSIVTKDTATAVGAVLTAAGTVFGLSSGAAGKLCNIADVDADSGVFTLFAGIAVTSSTIRYDFTSRLPGLVG